MNEKILKEEYYTIDGIANMFELNPFTVRRWIYKGKLKAMRIGRLYRIKGQWLLDFMQPTK